MMTIGGTQTKPMRSITFMTRMPITNGRGVTGARASGLRSIRRFGNEKRRPQKGRRCRSRRMLVIKTGDPGGTRTTGLRFRKPPLYPAELRGHTPQINILGKVPRAIAGNRRVLGAWLHL